MIKGSFAVVTVALACTTAACAGVPVTTRAARVEQEQCDPGRAPGDQVRLLQSTRVLRAQPLYSHVITSNNNSEDRVTGAQLVVRPPEGVSVEQLTRLLQCHSAQALLGQIDSSQFAADPYWLPGAWLDIDVKSENGNFVVVLSASSVQDGLQVFHRATAFAESQRPATP
jgi:hypothetical protein